MEEAIRRLWQALRTITERLTDLEVNHGETNEISFNTAFPTNPYNNQLVIRTDLNELYRYSSTTSSWLKIN